MPTIVEKTIGTGGDYADIAAWWAACPANLVSVDQIWRGKLLKQKHAGGQTLSGKTADATRYPELTTADGASFADAAITRLGYDPNAGAAIEVSASSTYGLEVSQQWMRLSKLQIAVTSTSANASIALTIPVANVKVDRCIIEGTSQNSVVPYTLRITDASTISNSIVVSRAPTSTASLAYLALGAKAINCTMVSLAAKLAVGIRTNYTAATLINCYIGNVSAVEDGTTVANKTTCYSDIAATGYSVAPFSTATFNNITDGTYDLRLPAGSALINAGTTNADGAVGITGTARPYGAAYDVGAWEYSVVDNTAPVLSVPAASAVSATSASGSVATDEAGGLLYYMASANATETAPTIIAASSQPVTATGAQTVSFTGLVQGTTYYAHYVQKDAANNTSNVANSTSFTTPAIDSVAPTWPGGAVITAGTITASSLAFSYPAASDNVAVHHYETSKDNGATWQNNGTGLSGQFTGLAGSTAFQIAVVAVDAQGNRSAMLTKSMTTATAPTTGTFKTMALANNAGTLHASGTAVSWEWHQARIGTSGSVTYGTGTVAGDGTVTATGLPVGAGYLLAAILGAALANDKPYYQAGTAT